MAILRFAGDRFVGTAAERTSFTALNGAVFFETDSLKVWLRVNNQWENIDPDLALENLTNVTINNVQSGEALFYNGINWVNREITEADISDLGSYLTSVALNDITDVTITSATSGNFLRFNGTNWVNINIAAGDIPDISSTYQRVSEKGQNNGYASLDSTGRVPSNQLPALAITEVFVVADIDARDALVIGLADEEVQQGDVAVVTDASDDPDVDSGSASYIYDGSAWIKLRTPDITAPGADTQIIFNDDGDFGASQNLTFDSGLLSLTGKFFLEEGGPSLVGLDPGEATQYVVTGTENSLNFTRLMARVGNVDYIIATHIES